MKTLERPKYITPEEWETEYEIDQSYGMPEAAKPRRDIHPNTIMSIVISVLIGIILAIAPQYRVLVGCLLASSAVSCIIFVGCSMIRRSLK